MSRLFSWQTYSFLAARPKQGREVLDCGCGIGDGCDRCVSRGVADEGGTRVLAYGCRFARGGAALSRWFGGALHAQVEPGAFRVRGGDLKGFGKLPVVC